MRGKDFTPPPPPTPLPLLPPAAAPNTLTGFMAPPPPRTTLEFPVAACAAASAAAVAASAADTALSLSSTTDFNLPCRDRHSARDASKADSVPANKARDVFARSTERREVRSLVAVAVEEDLASPALPAGLMGSAGPENPCFLLLPLLPPPLAEGLRVGLGGDGERTVKLSPFNSSSPPSPQALPVIGMNV